MIFVHIWQWFWNWFAVHTGTYNETGPYYGFFSGFGSDIGEVTIIAGLIAWWRSGQCHVDTCHKRGKYPFQHYRLCKIHHPAVPDKLTHLHVLTLHKHDKLER